MFKKGYTTIEILAVLSVFGIVTSTAIPNFQAIQNDAKITKAQAEVKVLGTLVERYRTEHGTIPNSLAKVQENAADLLDANAEDLFAGDGEYKLEAGRTETGKEYYVVYSAGLNDQKDFQRQGEYICQVDDDILATNLFLR